jgi:hypothetical protein
MKMREGLLGNKYALKHGKCHDRVYNIWYDMNARCNNPNYYQYKHWGGRGIRVLWKSFEEFYADMGDPPSGMGIERIDNSGDYHKANCKWATKWEQQANKRNNRLLTFKGETKHAAQWCRELGIKHSTLSMRLDRYGWSAEEALSCV